MDVLKDVTFNDIDGNLNYVCSLALIKFQIFIFCHIGTQSNPELEYAESHRTSGCRAVLTPDAVTEALVREQSKSRLCGTCSPRTGNFKPTGALRTIKVHDQYLASYTGVVFLQRLRSMTICG